MFQKGSVRRCELCKEQARVFCEADKASLCWQCDAEVHGANFLVAKHRRSLLCHSCGSPTTWLKAGFRIDPKVPFCQHCFHDTNCGNESDKNDDKCRTVESRASSTMSYASPRSLQQYYETEGNPKYAKNVQQESSKARGSDHSSCSASEAPDLLHLTEKTTAELAGPVKMCWMQAAYTGDESEIAAIYSELRQRSSSSNEGNETKIRAVLRRVLDGYATEESSSRLNTSTRRGRRKRRLEA